MTRKYLVAAAAAVTLFPAAASALTYDAFTSFNGTQGAGNFYYGEADPANPGTSGTFFGANTNCFIDGATCLQELANHDVPGFTKGGSPDFQYGTVNVPNDRLLAHPDNDGGQTFIAFVAPTAGRYRINATFNVQDINPSGVGINLITTTTGGLPLIFAPLGSINAANQSFSYSGIFDLGASYAVGFGLDNGGEYFNDSTGVNVSVSLVPEPGAWALMILGFGASGAMLRRRKAPLAA